MATGKPNDPLALLTSADQIGGVTYSNGFNPYYGHGRVNAAAALAAVSADVAGPAVTAVVLYGYRRQRPGPSHI